MRNSGPLGSPSFFSVWSPRAHIFLLAVKINPHRGDHVNLAHLILAVKYVLTSFPLLVYCLSLQVECYDIKAALTSKAQAVAGALMTQLSHKTNEDIAAVSDSYQEIHEQIQVEPNTPEELQELKEYIVRCQEKIRELQLQFDHITNAITLLSKFGYMPNDEDFSKYWVTYSWPQQVCLCTRLWCAGQACH